MAPRRRNTWRYCGCGRTPGRDWTRFAVVLPLRPSLAQNLSIVALAGVTAATERIPVTLGVVEDAHYLAMCRNYNSAEALSLSNRYTTDDDENTNTRQKHALNSQCRIMTPAMK